MSTPTLQPEVRADVTTTTEPARSPGPKRRSRPNRLPYWLIAPALVVMVLVHVLPAIGGLAISFKKFNLFTFHELFGAPWNGLENYRSILLDTDNPLHAGFWGAVSNTVVYTFWTVSGTLVGGLAIALLLHRKMPGQRVARTLMLVPWIVPSYVVAVLWSVHVAERRGDHQQGPRRLHPPAGPPADLAAGAQHDVGDRDPEHLARAAARDPHLPRRPAGAARRSCTRRRPSTAPARCGACASSRCRCCARSSACSCSSASSTRPTSSRSRP